MLRVLPSALLLAAIATASSLAGSEPQTGIIDSTQDYTAVELPTLPGLPYPRVTGIDSDGHAAGTNYACPFILSCLSRTFFYDGESLTDTSAEIVAAVPPQFVGLPNTMALGDGGRALLRMGVLDVGLYHYLWDNGESILISGDPADAPGDGPLVPMPPPPGEGWSINDHGVVVGSIPDQYGFLWDRLNGVSAQIPIPAGLSSISARGLNNHGHVVGTVGGASVSASRAFFWNAGEMTILPPLPGHIASFGLLINDDGTVAGVSLEPVTGNWVEHLVVWREGEIVGSASLGFDDGLLLAVQGISPGGEIVGNYWPTGSAFQHFAFRWNADDGFQDLNGSVSNIPDLNLWSAEGVNGQGQLAVWGDYPDFTGAAFLMSPLGCAQDTNGDGAVDVDDLVAVIIAFGTTDRDADVNGSGLVDIDDLIDVILNWGPC